MSILTKKVTLTTGQWARVLENASRDGDYEIYQAIDRAEILSVSDTYGGNRDEWLRQAVDVGVGPDVHYPDATSEPDERK